MTTRITRRRLLGGTAVAAGAVISWAAVGRLLPSEPRTQILERLGVDVIGPELRRLGERVNRRSPSSADRADDVAAGADGDLAAAIVVASRGEPSRPPVVVGGWLLPDLIAGVAGAAAAESTRR
jgi:hypothetical protein